MTCAGPTPSFYPRTRRYQIRKFDGAVLVKGKREQTWGNGDRRVNF
jgi:hypothetical protein